MNNFKTILSNKLQLTSDILLFNFELIEPKEINFIPGQYMILDVPQTDGQNVKRIYSIASSADIKNNFELMIKLIPNGIASTYLQNVKTTDQFSFQGPAGLFRLRENNKNKIFLATGTGIAPVRSIIKTKFQLPNPNLQTYVYWGLPYFKEVCLLEELKKLTQINANFHFKIYLSREQNFDMINEIDRQYFCLGHIDDQPLASNNSDYYLSGRRDVVESLLQNLLIKRISKENIIFEKF